MASFRVCKPRTQLGLVADQATGTGTFTVSWTTELEAEGEALWSAAAPTLVTIPRDGVYLITASYRRSAAGGNYGLTLRKNGVGIRAVLLANANAAVEMGFSLTTLQHLDAGDTLDVRGATSGATSSFRAFGTNLEVARLGPDRWT